MFRFAWLLAPVVGAFAGGVGGIIGIVIALAFFLTAPALVFVGFVFTVGIATGLAVGLPVKATVKRMDERR